jgi:hypothetical protein
MSQELFYTSAPKGLYPGSRGFCTVAATRGLPPALVEKLESLSVYRPLFPPLDPQAGLNPVAHSHLRLTAGGRSMSVLSRVGPAGLDYSERTNMFAHHVVLDGGELPRGGPAWVLQQPGFLEPAWDGEVRLLSAGRLPPRGDAPLAPCRAWQQAAGDAGWAGVVAESFVHDPGRPVYLLFDPGLDLLPLVAEALTLLSADLRWDVTFCTYFTGLPQGISCVWRCVPRGTAEAAHASRLPNALLLNLGTTLGPARGGGLVEQARIGRPGPAPRRAPADRESAPVPVSRPVRSPVVHAPAADLDWPDGPPPPPPLLDAPGAPIPPKGSLVPPVPRALPAPVAPPDRPRGFSPVFLPFAAGAGTGALFTLLLLVALWFVGGWHESSTRQARENEGLQYTRGRLERDNEDLTKLTRDLQRARDEAEAQRKKTEQDLKEATLQLTRQKQAMQADRTRRDGLMTQLWELQQELERVDTQRRALAERVRQLEGGAPKMEPEKKELPEVKKKVADGADKANGRPAESTATRKLPEVLALPHHKDKTGSWSLEELGVAPSKDNLLSLPDVAQEGVNEEITCPTPKGRQLTVSLGGGGPINRLALFELQGNKLVFTWLATDATNTKLLHERKLAILGADGTKRTLSIKVP